MTPSKEPVTLRCRPTRWELFGPARTLSGAASSEVSCPQIRSGICVVRSTTTSECRTAEARSRSSSFAVASAPRYATSKKYRSGIPRRCRSLRRHEAVASATHGLDEWIETGDVELLSQVTDVHVDHVVARVKSVLPHFVQDPSA